MPNIPLPVLDGKFYAAVDGCTQGGCPGRGVIRKHKDHSIVSPEQFMVFLAQDNAFAATLPVYREICEGMGADAEHLAAVDRTIERLYEWRRQNPDRCKVPDAAGETLAG